MLGSRSEAGRKLTLLPWDSFETVPATVAPSESRFRLTCVTPGSIAVVKVAEIVVFTGTDVAASAGVTDVTAGAAVAPRS